MRRAALGFCILMLTLSAVPAGAGVTAAAGPGPGYFATDNVGWVRNIPLHPDSAGAAFHGSFMYITDSQKLTIYNISDPLNPVPTSVLPLPQTPYAPEEDVNTNGSLVIITSPLGRGTSGMYVIDVKDKANPQIIGTLAGVESHTTSCLLNCTWAYNSNGQIIDLRDPTKPTLAGNWRTTVAAPSAHDVTEISPGLVMTSSDPLYLLDARENPAKPTVITTAKPKTNRFVHSNVWPGGGTDKYLLVGGETGGNCNTTTAGAFMTFSTPEYDETGKMVKGFQQLDEYRVGTGLYPDGKSPYDTFCAHWFTTHPKLYKDGGLLAMGWYEHGTRFLDVNKDTGKITEVGYFLPVGGSTSAAYWINDTVLYNVDYQRGIDIITFTNTPATGEVRTGGAAAASATGLPKVTLPLARRPEYACRLTT